MIWITASRDRTFDWLGGVVLALHVGLMDEVEADRLNDCIHIMLCEWLGDRREVAVVQPR